MFGNSSVNYARFESRCYPYPASSQDYPRSSRILAPAATQVQVSNPYRSTGESSYAREDFLVRQALLASQRLDHLLPCLARLLLDWHGNRLALHVPELRSGEGFQRRFPLDCPNLYEATMRLTVAPVPLIRGRPPRTCSEGGIKVPISTVAAFIRFYSKLIDR